LHVGVVAVHQHVDELAGVGHAHHEEEPAVDPELGSIL
jgi:hypothetical protein